MFSLDGKTALVTGASGGIGKAIAVTLHQQGAHVILHGTNQARLEALSAELTDRNSVLAADLSDRDAVEAMIPKAAEMAGAVDILVNNAGITRDNLFMRLKDEEWDQVLNVNMTSSMILCRAAIRAMMKARWGRIISISSIVGVTGNPGQTNYAASKAGMIGFSKSLAQEVASRGITVNVVAPGFIQTQMTDVLTDEQKDKLLVNVPCGRLGQPEDIALAVGYLASDEAGYITGATLHVNGGMAML